MSAFQFRLQTLLRLRIAERDERRADLAKALRAEQMLHDQRQQIEAEQGESLAAVRSRSAPGSADVDGLLQISRYQLLLKSRREQILRQLAQVAAEIERRRQVLVEADRQVRVLENLRERQELAHGRRLELSEVKQLDEAALIAFARRAEVPS